MLQLILDVGSYAIAMPESQKKGYAAWEETLSNDLVMIKGNMVKELRGNVWRISYQYGVFDDTTKANLLAAVKRGQTEPILCSFLPPDGEELITANFFVTEFKYPKFMWSAEGKPMWADFGVELREVHPHD